MLELGFLTCLLLCLPQILLGYQCQFYRSIISVRYSPTSILFYSFLMCSPCFLRGFWQWLCQKLQSQSPSVSSTCSIQMPELIWKQLHALFLYNVCYSPSSINFKFSAEDYFLWWFILLRSTHRSWYEHMLWAHGVKSCVALVRLFSLLSLSFSLL